MQQATPKINVDASRVDEEGGGRGTGGTPTPSSTATTASGYVSEAHSTGSTRSVGVAPLSLPVRNGRKGSKKVRTGCITCKIRRVKCDETKPECQRCVKTGRRCDGYLQRPNAGSLTRESLSPAPGRGNSPGPPRLPAAYPGWELSEQRAFHFYRTCSSNQLFSPATTSFWGRVIPGLCFQEPAIRHAALAISDLHERGYHGLHTLPLASDRPGYPGLSSFAAMHYGKAMKALQGWTPPKEGPLAGSASIAIPLLACALFICIEFMLGNEPVAQLHINQGRQILATFQGDESTRSHPGVELIRNELVPIFTRLSLASFFFGSAPAPIPETLRWTRTDPGTENVMIFKDIAEAEQALYEIMDNALRFSRIATIWVYASAQQPDSEAKEAHRQSLLSEQAHYAYLFEKWNVAFAVLRTTPPPAAGGSSKPPNPLEELSAKMCRLYYLSAHIFVARALKELETEYDVHTPAYASIIVLGNEILDECERLDAKSGGPSQVSRFSFESGIIAPLYFTSRSRHPGLRRAGIAVLRRRALRTCNENLWNARRIVLVCERITAIEEERAGACNFGLDDPPGAYPGDTFANDIPDYEFDEFTKDLIKGDGPNGFSEDYPAWLSMMESRWRRPLTMPEGGQGSSTAASSASEEDIDNLVRHLPTATPPSFHSADAARIFGAERDPRGPPAPDPVSPSGQARPQGKTLPPPLELPPWAQDGGQALRPPFNIPERVRIRNVVISPQVGGGNWVTFFMTPDPGSGPHWSVIREFIE